MGSPISKCPLNKIRKSHFLRYKLCMLGVIFTRYAGLRSLTVTDTMTNHGNTTDTAAIPTLITADLTDLTCPAIVHNVIGGI
jgi:hypothetical protein